MCAKAFYFSCICEILINRIANIGKPLMTFSDVSNPDWIPTLQMGYRKKDDNM